jgi:ATP-binding cassette subfamily C protein
MKTVKSYGAEARNIEIFGALTAGLARRCIDATVNHGNLRAWFSIGAMLVLSLAVYLSIRLLALPTADILLLVFLFARLMPRVSTIQQHFHHFVSVLPSHAAVRRLERQALAAQERQT